MPGESKEKVKRTKTLALKKKEADGTHSNDYSGRMEHTSAMGSISLLQTPTSLSTDKENTINTSSAMKHTKAPVDAFDSSMKLSENPFDIFSGSLVQKKIPVEAKAPTVTVETKTSVTFLLSGLRSSQSQPQSSQAERKTGVFNQITVISKSNLSISSKKYYKFPFDTSLVNDESLLFSVIKEGLVFALSSAYSNFRRFGESFKVIVDDEVFSFSTSTTCPPSSEKLLKANDIGYLVEDGVIKVDQADSGLLHDILMNLEVPKGRRLPFILSQFEFEGGIMFRTKVRKGPMVRSGGTIEYLYTVNGPFDLNDFTFDDCVIVEYK